MKHEAFVSR